MGRSITYGDISGIHQPPVFEVVNTSLPNHSSATQKGTLAWALAQCRADGGGSVFIGPGTFDFSSATLSVPQNTSVFGSGYSTELAPTGSINLFTFDEGLNQLCWNTSFRDFHVTMPISGGGHAFHVSSHGIAFAQFENLLGTGGTVGKWFMNVDQFYQCFWSGLKTEGRMGAMRLFNSDPTTYPSNVGDSLVQNCDFALTNTGGAVIKIDGPANTTTGVNNIMFNRIECIAQSANHLTVGFHLENCSRITAKHIDLELLDIGVVEMSQVNSGMPSVDNRFDWDTVYFIPDGSNIVKKKYLRGAPMSADTTAGNANMFVLDEVASYFGLTNTTACKIYQNADESDAVSSRTINSQSSSGGTTTLVMSSNNPAAALWTTARDAVIAPNALLMPTSTNQLISPGIILSGHIAASPYSWRNPHGFPVDMVVTGGTVSALDYSRDNSTWFSLGITAGIVQISPGDYLRTTYTVAPTFTVIPRG